MCSLCLKQLVPFRWKVSILSISNKWWSCCEWQVEWRIVLVGITAILPMDVGYLVWISIPSNPTSSWTRSLLQLSSTPSRVSKEKLLLMHSGWFPNNLLSCNKNHVKQHQYRVICRNLDWRLYWEDWIDTTTPSILSLNAMNWSRGCSKTSTRIVGQQDWIWVHAYQTLKLMWITWMRCHD